MNIAIGNTLVVLFWIFAVCVVLRTVFSAITKTDWWSRNIVGDFPYEDRCWECNYEQCPSDCPILKD